MAASRLTYFEMRGRAEAIRLTLHASDIEFVDERVVDSVHWEQLKAATPFGRLPIFETGSLTICESHAVLRHLGRESGWLGIDETTDVELDTTQEILSEAQEDLWRFAWVDGYGNQMDRYAAETLDPTLDRLQGWFLRGGAATYWVGASPTHVDFLAFVYLDELDAFFPDSLARFIDLSGFRSRVESIPGVDRYLASGNRPIVFGIGNAGPKVDRRKPLPDAATFRSPWHHDLQLA